MWGVGASARCDVHIDSSAHGCKCFWILQCSVHTHMYVNPWTHCTGSRTHVCSTRHAHLSCSLFTLFNFYMHMKTKPVQRKKTACKLVSAQQPLQSPTRAGLEACMVNNMKEHFSMCDAQENRVADPEYISFGKKFTASFYVGSTKFATCSLSVLLQNLSAFPKLQYIHAWRTLPPPQFRLSWDQKIGNDGKMHTLRSLSLLSSISGRQPLPLAQTQRMS